jgi:hypothetical protein
MKDSKKQFEFVKDSETPKRNYIFQNDRITKIGAFIVVSFIIGLIIAVAVSGIFI